jgi:hypothetical protein
MHRLRVKLRPENSDCPFTPRKYVEVETPRRGYSICAGTGTAVAVHEKSACFLDEEEDVWSFPLDSPRPI